MDLLYKGKYKSFKILKSASGLRQKAKKRLIPFRKANPVCLNNDIELKPI